MGVRQWGEEFLENQTLKLEGFGCRTSTGLGETETPLLEGTHKVVCAYAPRGRSSDPTETEPNLPASVGGSPAGVGVAVSHCEDKDTGSRSSGKYSLA